MPDVFSSEFRSLVMSRIRSRGNAATELCLIKIFRQNKISGWRRHQNIFGKPDFVFREQKLAVFVDGCFWHGCPSHCRMPQTNEAFWRAKIERNMLRDKAVNRELKKLGWRTIRIWQHELANTTKVVRRLEKFLV